MNDQVVDGNILRPLSDEEQAKRVAEAATAQDEATLRTLRRQTAETKLKTLGLTDVTIQEVLSSLGY